MTTSFPGFSSPGASTEAPLEMLAACHQRIVSQCSTLKRLAEHLPVHGSDADARRAATSLKRYFNTAAIQHHADEEQDLFPALIESMAGSDAVCIRGLTTALSDEHRMLERQWRRLEVVLDAVERGEAAALPADAVSGFISLYQRHIQREEDELLPMAARLLGDHDIENIGRAMRQRRGIADID
ncbi:hemerythrin domain-containing protein [Pollutimonas thiosulfatoxidans]|uniref:Cation-binding protein n=1 Tax=Pollutimonas thiosulfatoxidans TaxID=2028345 RepID=A0A410G9Y9_9BURK|nr:hemerythrin domain-containing protein [Pollutimonas thiosulfatoxidans]MBF6617936.1 hemerythrin domain-containing protein [Candidimonas sp.]NYT44952.1 hemerythrin domain-containing protein [Alcaligenaceae bacterium]QAA93124.1 cation-binding protein [Pollutimonas thiosulfatoxidans]